MRAIEFITERKMANLYHTTGLRNALDILSHGKIDTRISDADDGYVSDPYVSLTRDQKYIYSDEIKFVIDQTKLANTHKITPIDWNFSDAGESWFGDDKSFRRSESEERVNRPIPVSYITHIIVNDKPNKSTERLSELAKKLNIPITFGKLHDKIDNNNPVPVRDTSNDYAIVTEPGLTWVRKGERITKPEYDEIIRVVGDLSSAGVEIKLLDNQS